MKGDRKQDKEGNVGRQRGRPKKYCEAEQAPMMEDLFPTNCATLLSGMLLYVGKVLDTLGSTVNNKAFLIYGYDEKKLNPPTAALQSISERLKKMCKHLQQVGPQRVVDELFEMITFLDTLLRVNDDKQTLQQFLERYSKTQENNLMQFTDYKVLEYIQLKIPDLQQKLKIQSAYHEFLDILADTVICEIKGRESSKMDDISRSITELEKSTKKSNKRGKSEKPNKRRANEDLDEDKPTKRIKRN